jgi:hypothetical protein
MRLKHAALSDPTIRRQQPRERSRAAVQIKAEQHHNSDARSRDLQRNDESLKLIDT